jgi:hypothetical protein
MKNQIHLITEMVMTQEIFDAFIVDNNIDAPVFRMPYALKDTIPLQERVAADISEGVFSGNIDEILDWENEVESTLGVYNLPVTKNYTNEIFRIKMIEGRNGFKGWIIKGIVQPTAFGIDSIKNTITISKTS